jgi:hypothetical protein
MITIVSILTFILCWLAFMINFILMAITKFKLNKALKKRLPNIRRNLSMQNSDFSFYRVKSTSSDLIKMIFSFGSNESSTTYYNNFVDVEAIEHSNDDEIKRLLAKSIRIIGNFPKFWIVMIGSILLGALSSVITN